MRKSSAERAFSASPQVIGSGLAASVRLTILIRTASSSPRLTTRSLVREPTAARQPM